MVAIPKVDIDKMVRFLESASKENQEYESTTIKCGIVGRSGVGKSSLINAITGKKLALVGSSKETTRAAQEYAHRGLIFVDLPGCGTKNFPTADYVKRLELQTYDLFIFVTESRFFQDDETIYTQLVAMNKPCFLLRSKFDLALENAVHDGSTLTPEELKQEVDRDIRDNLAPLEVGRVYMVSARKPALYDLSELLDDITSSFDGMKRMRLENDFAAWSREALERKKVNALRIATWYASLSALNGLNPILGLDILLDLEMLRRLAREVGEIYNVTVEQKDYWKSMLYGPEGALVLKKIVELAAKHGSPAAIELALKTIVKNGTTLSVSKLIPFVGNVVACGAGFTLTYTFGVKLVNEYHALAEEILTDFKRPQVLSLDNPANKMDIIPL